MHLSKLLEFLESLIFLPIHLASLGVFFILDALTLFHWELTLPPFCAVLNDLSCALYHLSGHVTNFSNSFLNWLDCGE